MSELISWNDSLSVGIDEIDEQHKVLVQLLNDLNGAVGEGHGSEACLAILDRLVEYTRIHFAVEEALMRIFEYSEYENHKTAHEELIDEVLSMRHEITHSDRKINFKLLHFLNIWLTRHIVESDKAYAEHFLSRGMPAKSGKRSWFSRIWS